MVAQKSKFIFSHHAIVEMKRRGLPKKLVLQTLANPDQIVPGYNDKSILQRVFKLSKGKSYLIRAVVDTKALPQMVITVYKTSKITKYWEVQ
jgi:hypothetical protein